MSDSTSVSSGLLVGNAFPLSLVRRRVVIEPSTVDALRRAQAGRTIRSFWGHANTLDAINSWLGTNLSPASTRPALMCDPTTMLPTLDGEVFAECWVISPDYEAGFRPVPNAEIPPEKIRGWQILRIKWE